VMQAMAGGDVGAELLALSRDHAATLMVAGCYGHSRFREILLGGVTRTLLKSMTVPVLMAH
jgi:nucleotide-binding universal stress UspA family protein